MVEACIASGGEGGSGTEIQGDGQKQYRGHASPREILIVFMEQSLVHQARLGPKYKVMNTNHLRKLVPLRGAGGCGAGMQGDRQLSIK